MRNIDSRFLFDPIAFRDDLNSSWQLLQQESGPVRRAILSRYEDAARRTGTTTDIYSLQRLDAFQKFLREVAADLDCRDAFIARMLTNFNSLDDTYWDGVIRGQELISENSSLKAELERLYIQIQIIEGKLKKALQRHRKAMGYEQVELQTNKSKAA